MGNCFPCSYLQSPVSRVTLPSLKVVERFFKIGHLKVPIYSLLLRLINSGLGCFHPRLFLQGEVADYYNSYKKPINSKEIVNNIPSLITRFLMAFYACALKNPFAKKKTYQRLKETSLTNQED